MLSKMYTAYCSTIMKPWPGELAVKWRGTLWCDDSMFNLDWNNADYKNIHIPSNYTLKPNTLYVTWIVLLEKLISQGWRAGSVVKSTCYSCRGPRFCPQHSERLTTCCDSRYRRANILFWPLDETGSNVMRTHTFRQKTHTIKVHNEVIALLLHKLILFVYTNLVL